MMTPKTICVLVPQMTPYAELIQISVYPSLQPSSGVGRCSALGVVGDADNDRPSHYYLPPQYLS